MYKINANEKGSRTIEVSDEHLRVLEKYDLLERLTGSDGHVDEDTLDKLLVTTNALADSLLNDAKTLMNLQREVLLHRDMKALGLKNLMKLYEGWKNGEPKASED